MLHRTRAVILNINQWMVTYGPNVHSKYCKLYLNGHNGVLHIYQRKLPKWLGMFLFDSNEFRHLRSGTHMQHHCNFKVTRTKNFLVWPRIQHFRTKISVFIHRRLCLDARSVEKQGRGALLFFKVIHSISKSLRPNKITRLFAVIKYLRFATTAHF